ncbi:MAG: phosphatase PAP2 family protein [Solirubrobacterales bacterium]|nr:phosphatase PAP2 family protein [Solirubrobacterales bacterium]
MARAKIRPTEITPAVPNRKLVFALGCGLSFALVYFIFVFTAHGQWLENRILWEQDLLQPASAANDHAGPIGALIRRVPMLGDLRHISIASIAIAIGCLLLIGMLRRRWWLGFIASGVVGCSVVAAEVLKELLPRPSLHESIEGTAHNSFPSGHTAIAVSIVLAAILVSPNRLRSFVALFGALWAGAIAAATVAVGWHRPSDTLGGALLASGVFGIAVAVVTQYGILSSDTSQGTKVSLLASRLLLAGASLSFLVSAWWLMRLIAAYFGADTRDGSLNFAEALASGFTLLAIVTALWLLRPGLSAVVPEQRRKRNDKSVGWSSKDIPRPRHFLTRKSQ